MIYTGYYGKLEEYEKAGLEPIAISGTAPCWFEGYHFPFFAPTLDIFTKWKNKNMRYTKASLLSEIRDSTFNSAEVNIGTWHLKDFNFSS